MIDAERMRSMKRVTMTVEFVLQDNKWVKNLSEEDIMRAVRNMLEDVNQGIAEYGSAGVTSIKVDEI